MWEMTLQAIEKAAPLGWFAEGAGTREPWNGYSKLEFYFKALFAGTDTHA